MSEFTDDLRDYSERVEAARSFLGIDAKRVEAQELQARASDPSLWDDPSKGQQVTQRLARLGADIDRYEFLRRKLDDALAIDELLSEGEDDRELDQELSDAVTELGQDLEKLELAALLSGEYDGHDAIGTLQAGEG